MDGLELLARIQELRPEIPTLLITGHAEQSLIIRALRGGAYDFIQKPIDRIYFVAALHRAIQTRQLRRQIQEQQQALTIHAQSLEQLVQERTRDLLVVNQAMKGLVHTVLDIARIQTNTFRLQRTRCNLVELCQHVLDEYTAAADLALTFACGEERIEAEVDPDRISRVLLNVLTHAYTDSPKGSPVTITLQQAEERAIITVRDMGIGIAEEVLPHLFEPFSRVPEGEIQVDSPDGLGLGLYISRKIVERHAGSIEIQSRPGGGRTCSLVLPLAADPSTERAEDRPLAMPEPCLFPVPRWLVS
jgi:signal transduction histidine kinase